MRSNLSTPAIVAVLVVVVLAVVGVGWYFTMREPPLRLRQTAGPPSGGKGGVNTPMATPNVGDVSK